VANYVSATTVLQYEIIGVNEIKLSIGNFETDRTFDKSLIGSKFSLLIRGESVYEDQDGQFEGEVEEIDFEAPYYGFTIYTGVRHIHMHTLNTKNYSVGDKIKFNIHQDRII
jgi:hypothetical protein